MKKTKDYFIEDGFSFITVHLRFLQNDALITILSSLYGVEKVEARGKYSIVVVYGKMFTKSEIANQVSKKIDEYIDELI